MRRQQQHARQPRQSRGAKGAAKVLPTTVSRTCNEINIVTTQETRAATTTEGAVIRAIAPPGIIEC